MTPSARDWLDGLRAFAGDLHRLHPGAAPAPWPPGAAAQRAILAAHLSAWIEGDAAAVPESHAIVLTTSALGIAVAEEVFGCDEPLAASLRGRLAAVREIDYRMWTKDHPDPKHRLHVNHWSWIKAPVPEQRWHEFRRHPLAAGEAYWLHRVGTSGPGAAESRHAHLWKWTGRHAMLLQAFFRESIDAL